MDKEEMNDIKSPIKRLGSTRKLLIFNNVRIQLNEQLKHLDTRMEAQVAFITDLLDFYRKKIEIEQESSKSLDKLVLNMKSKNHKQKREWPLFSAFDFYQHLIKETKMLSENSTALSDIYIINIMSCLNQTLEDIQRIYKRCREIGSEIHEEIIGLLRELTRNQKFYHMYQTDVKQTETKLREAEQQQKKELTKNADRHEKFINSRRYRMIEKEVNKKKEKFDEAVLRTLKARNDYLLSLEASNTTVHKYFVEDLSDIMNCMDFAFHNCLERVIQMHASAEEGKRSTLKLSADVLSAAAKALDSGCDKKRFLDMFSAAFMIPPKVEFDGEFQNPEPKLETLLHGELVERLEKLQKTVKKLKIKTEEVQKTLETTEKSLLIMHTMRDDCTKYFGDNATAISKPPETLQIKLRADKQETEEFYLTKFREYLLSTSRIARLEAKHDYIKQHLLNLNENPIETTSIQKKNPRRKIGRLQLSKEIKLFGGSLEEYLEITQEDVPLIIRSCIRAIQLRGMHYTGIFRVSGSQVEINKFKEIFERGEDPFVQLTDPVDINSVAGVLKLYLRELREPLFPLIYFKKLLDISNISSPNEIIIKLKEFIESLPKSRIIVLRYLFSFLHHLSEYADENMMDANNLAVCFGPSVISIPDEYDLVTYQNCINMIIKYIIIFAEEIFPDNLGGMKYQKFLTEELHLLCGTAKGLPTGAEDSSNYSEDEIDQPKNDSVEELTNESHSLEPTTSQEETSTAVTPDNESQQELQMTTNFSMNRELWQRRATSQTQPMPSTAKSSSYSRASQEFREMRQKHTPDLVMDLPLTQDSIDNSSIFVAPATAASKATTPTTVTSLLMPEKQSSHGEATATDWQNVRQQCSCPESPDMSTAAERFAKQNQCTLKKKSTKIGNSCTDENSGGNSKLRQMEHEESSGDAESENQITVDNRVSTSIVDSDPISVVTSNRNLIRAGRSDDFITLPTPKIVAKFADMHLTGGSQMTSFKPQVKVKPTILRKPVLPPRMSPELARKQDGT